VSPAGDGGEGGGALHSVSDETQVVGEIGGGGCRPYVAVQAAGAVGLAVEHRAKYIAADERGQVLCDIKQAALEARKDPFP